MQAKQFCKSEENVKVAYSAVYKTWKMQSVD